MAMRRLVICYDGTWNTEDKGVGTAGGTDAIKGGGFGAGLSANVLDGYRFLANNFEAGDELYLFGFSRGAYTARSLAGLIGLAGLLDPADLGGTLKSVMEIYRRPDSARSEKRAAIAALACKGAWRDPVGITCVGVWDTVGSLGIPGDIGRVLLKSSHSFHDVELGPHVDVALHAVAIDEKRGAFPPTLWASPSGQPGRPDQVVQQVWFAGAHSTVGGSYADSGLSDIAFDWMVRRVTRHTGLALVPAPASTAEPCCTRDRCCTPTSGSSTARCRRATDSASGFVPASRAWTAATCPKTTCSRSTRAFTPPCSNAGCARRCRTTATKVRPAIRCRTVRQTLPP